MSDTKTIAQALAGASFAEPPADSQKTVKQLFMLLHGMYGQLFLSRFETGHLDAEGRDRGTKSAMVVWQQSIGGFDGDIVRAAAERCKDDHQKFPPTLPEFVAICKAIQPRKVHPQSQPRLGMSDEFRAAQVAKARAEAMATYQRRLDAEKRDTEGLPLLSQLIAQAVALAGGDEVGTLRKLEVA